MASVSSLENQADPGAASAPSASLPRKLAKYPAVERIQVIAETQTTTPGSARQSQSQTNSIPAVQPVPVVSVGPGQRPASAINLSSTSRTVPIAAAGPIQAAQQPMAVAHPVQPIAASGTGSSNGYGGSRAALNLFNIRGLVNLVHAPLPPVVTPSSTAPTAPKSTPQTAPSTSSNPPPSSSSGGSTPNPQTSTPSSNQPSNAPAPVQKTGNAILSWNIGTENDLAGYKVYVGTRSGTYSYPGSPFTIGRVTTYTLNNLPQGQTYYFALSAYDNAGNTSGLSAEVHKSIY
ncbi:fibronectin type III domain-containing protein [Nitrospira japonica]|nr:fibronectin type III domain-containing protein [Nitrospira japonica]